MNLDLPVPTQTLGPLWATELNDALDVIDSHDHTNGKGVQIPTSGLNINANLDFNGYKPFDLLSTQYALQNSTLTGASNANSVYVVSGNLYYTNGSGIAVQVTSGGSVVSTPANTVSLEYISVNTNLAINPSDTFVTLGVDTTASRTITLPLASAVVTGRIYIIKDATGDSNANPITLDADGSDQIDGAASQNLSSDYGAWMVQTDGVSNWSFV
jgi:hypothetical protein